MTSFSVINQIWSDSRLSWNSSLYNNFISINLPLDSIWKPTTGIVNSAYGDGFLSTNKDYNYADIHNDGTVILYSQSISLQTRCNLDIAKYPFDSQTCNLTFVSWPFFEQPPKVIYYFTNQTSSISTIWGNHSVWDLLNISYSTDDDYSKCGYNVMFNLQRKSVYIMLNSVVPCLILNIILIIAFFLPFTNQIALSKKINYLYRSKHNYSLH